MLSIAQRRSLKTKKFTGEKLIFKVDGETSYGSRLEIQLPAGAENTFKV